jgi:serine/threonine protein kinase/WD40 repeat protein
MNANANSDPSDGAMDPATAHPYDTAGVRRARELLGEPLPPPPESVGPYRILELIGRGGMGEVYRAEQRVPLRREVALKLIKPGMDSRAVLTRFEAERQALAMMDHPNIARILEGGTTDGGQPYFVMELVRGIPVTQYCDQRRMGVRGRLDLFMTICSAVQHAHQKGIIHRDLKPSNILVTEHDGKPVPKVIDFGLAKALGGTGVLTAETLFTAFGHAAGTPTYMAPEQVAINALDVDTRADIYALGVLLYELLTGTPPHDRDRLQEAAWEEVRRVIREEDPVRPSQRLQTSGTLATLAATRDTEPGKLLKSVQGDLDWIILKALEKDRNRRYDSATSLAADLGRHLGDEPVQARPPNKAYQLRKFVRRHRTTVIVGASLAVVLGAGVIATSWQWRRAENNATEARQNAQVAEGMRVTAAQERDRAVAAGDRAEQALGVVKQQAAELENYSYAYHINEAWTCCRNGFLANAIKVLERCPIGRRGPEWDFVHNLADSKYVTVKAHSGPVSAMAFSTEPGILATAGDDKTVKVWDLNECRRVPLTNQTVKTPRTSIEVQQKVLCLVFSRDGRYLLGVSGGKSVHIWNTGDLSPRGELDGEGDHLAVVAVNTAGNLCAAAGADGVIRVWDIVSGELLHVMHGHKKAITALHFSPVRNLLASGDAGGEVRMWNPTTGVQYKNGTAHTGELSTRFPVLDLAFNSRGNLIVASDDPKATVGSYESSPDDENNRPGEKAEAPGQLVAPDLPHFVFMQNSSVACDDAAEIYAEIGPGRSWAAVGNGGWCLQEPVKLSHAAAVSPDGRWAGFGHDTGNVSANLSWFNYTIDNRAVRKIWSSVPSENWLSTAPLQFHGNTAFRSDKAVTWILPFALTHAENERFTAIPGDLMSASADGSKLLIRTPVRYDSTDETPRWRVYDVQSKSFTSEWMEDHGPTVLTADGTSVIESVKNQLIFRRCSDLVETGRISVTMPTESEGKVTGLETSPDGRLLAYAVQYQGPESAEWWSNVAGAVGVIEISSGRLLWHADGLPATTFYVGTGYRPVGLIQFSPDSTRLMVAGADLTLFDAASGTKVRSVASDWIDCLCFTPDGKRFFTSQRGVGVCMWDTASLTKLLRWPGGEEDGVTALTLAPDGDELLWLNTRGHLCAIPFGRTWVDARIEAALFPIRQASEIVQQIVDPKPGTAAIRLEDIESFESLSPEQRTFIRQWVTRSVERDKRNKAGTRPATTQATKEP